MMQKLAATLLVAGMLALPGPAEAQSRGLEGSWSGGGLLSFASGGREQVRCRAHYSRRSNEGYVVRATCASASGRAVQTASLRKIGANRYTGSFYNREYGISGTIFVIARGSTQSVRLTSSAATAALTFSR